MMQNVKENLYEKLLLLCANSSVAVLLLIVIFISFVVFLSSGNRFKRVCFWYYMGAIVKEFWNFANA